MQHRTAQDCTAQHCTNMENGITIENQERLLAWAAGVIGISRFKGDAKAIGRVIDGRMAAVVVWDTFSTTDCCIHIASDGSMQWATRQFLHLAFHYPLVQCGLWRVTAMVDAANRKAISFNTRLGFRREGVFREAAPSGNDMIAFGMLRRECFLLSKEQRHDPSRTGNPAACGIST